MINQQKGKRLSDHLIVTVYLSEQKRVETNKDIDKLGRQKRSNNSSSNPLSNQ